jgi:hypothetical protein
MMKSVLLMITFVLIVEEEGGNHVSMGIWTVQYRQRSYMQYTILGQYICNSSGEE